MKAAARTRKDHDSLSARFVDRLAFAAANGGEIADNIAELGTESLLAQLRTGVKFAPAIAASAGRVNVANDLVNNAAAAMYKASPVERAADTNVYDDWESWYLIGILVGIEIAGGLR